MAKDPSKTEKATAKKRDDARKKGQVAISQEVGSAAVLMSSFLVFYFTGSYVLRNTLEMMHKIFNESASFVVNESTIYTVFVESILTFSKIIAPLMLIITVAGLAASILQVGFRATLETMSFKLNKLDPVKGFSKLCSKKSLFELPKSTVKVVFVGLICYITIRQEITNVFMTVQMNSHELLSYIGGISMKILYRTLWALIVLAVIDYIFQKHEHEEDLKMTKEEVKDENKQREGDPKVKGNIRSIQYQMARRRMMEAVPRADVVVTNPEHLAIALKYDRDKMMAPTVVAKGADLLAEKIKEIARKNGIPLVENKPLARTLYKLVDIGEVIPVTLYKAVAEVLAYVYRLKDQRYGKESRG